MAGDKAPQNASMPRATPGRAWLPLCSHL